MHSDIRLGNKVPSSNDADTISNHSENEMMEDENDIMERELDGLNQCDNDLLGQNGQERERGEAPSASKANSSMAGSKAVVEGNQKSAQPSNGVARGKTGNLRAGNSTKSTKQSNLADWVTPSTNAKASGGKKAQNGGQMNGFVGSKRVRDQNQESESKSNLERAVSRFSAEEGAEESELKNQKRRR
mmetsp:Transcript_6382/g.10820  ORF Transcript_6382/g.10820 Transcript_6382/m.10820 type:complete len:187 (-) Transcript_6382:74-634(-)